MGDFNIDSGKSDCNTVNFISKMQCFLLNQIITLPTRVTDSSSSTIDHIYTNINTCHVNTGTLVTDISDHFPIFAMFENFNINLPISQSVTKRDFKNYDRDSFISDLQNVDWSSVINNNSNVDEAFDAFSSLFTDVCDHHAPLKVKVVKVKRKKNPWITKAIKKSVKTKHKLLSKVISSQHNPDVVLRYKTYRNILTSTIRKAKQTYYADLFTVSKGARLWNVINDVLGKKNCSDKVPPTLKVDTNSSTRIVSEPADVVEEFNKYFVSVGQRLANNIPQTNCDFWQNMGLPQLQSFFLQPVTPLDIKALLINLDRKKASGWDNLTPRLLIDAAEVIAPPLAHVINCSFLIGTFPSALKVAKVKPTFKKGENDSVGNYRPISILPLFSKINELKKS
ncbi:uncharacterized protein LOC144433705 [Glandiceps talaboti]